MIIKSKKSFKFSILVVLLLISISFLNITFTNKTDDNPNKNSLQSIENYNKLRYSSVWNLSNIYINNNWSEAVNEYDWCNYEDGYYIIENVSFTGVPYIKNGIRIENTTENFIIRNRQINNGISLLETNNGQIINNNITFGPTPTGSDIQVGIYMRRCNNTSIKSNIINDTYIERNTLVYVILTYESNNITIIDNFLSANQPYDWTNCRGISCQRMIGSRDINVINNTICNNAIGIDLQSYFNKIINNNIYNSRGGIWVHNDFTLISNNSIKNCDDYGIKITEFNHSIFNNTIINSAESGIWLMNSYNNKIINNKLDKNSIGIKLEECTYGIDKCNIISNNSILNENDYGFYLEESNYIIISNNSIQDSKKSGIFLERSNRNLITGNHITNVKDCIKEINCYDNLIENNICHKTPNLILGYFPWIVLGIMFITTLFILKIKIKRQKQS